MIVCIASSCGTDLSDQYTTPVIATETLSIRIPAADASLIKDAISSELPRPTQSFTQINIKRSHYSANLLDSAKDELEDRIYRLYFAEYISEKTENALKKKNLKDPNKYKLHTLLSAQNSTTLFDLEHYLSKMRRFRFFNPQHIRFALVENFIYHATTSEKVATLNALVSIFSYLDERGTDRHSIEAKAIPIINTVFQLFKIPDIMDIDPANLLKDLLSKNHNLSLTVIQFEAIKEFYTNQHRQHKSMIECRDILNPLLSFLEPYLS